ncbi:MAG: hypothetical protein HOP32_09695 [Nitrospira sp.]|nr:hypothetical protein [Nitrospira sp.]
MRIGVSHPLLVAFGRVLLLRVGLRWPQTGQVRKFGTEIAPTKAVLRPATFSPGFSRGGTKRFHTPPSAAS